MTDNLVDLNEARRVKVAKLDQAMLDYFLSLPSTLTGEQCTQGREKLGWSIEALAFRSGASVQAIRQFESGKRELRDVTRQALSFALESEGLLIMPGHPPMMGGNCRGATVDPRKRDDFHLME